MATNNKMEKEGESTAPSAMQEEMVYYLITDAAGSMGEQMTYPIEAVFAISFGEKSSTKTPHGKHKTTPNFIIRGQTPSEINDQILKLLSPGAENQQKAFFIDRNSSLPFADCLALYHLLLQNYKHVYFLGSMTKEKNDFPAFTEIFPDERSIMLFEQIPEFAPSEKNEK
jgi:hypothetical protein